MFGLFVIDCPALGEDIGRWLKSYDPDANDGIGAITFTDDAATALRFADWRAAMDEWQRVSTVRPRRLDGKPNRPLSAYTVSPLPLDQPVPPYLLPPKAKGQL